MKLAELEPEFLKRTFADLTLNPSVHLPGEGCGAHFFVRNGEIVGA